MSEMVERKSVLDVPRTRMISTEEFVLKFWRTVAIGLAVGVSVAVAAGGLGYWAGTTFFR